MNRFFSFYTSKKGLSIKLKRKDGDRKFVIGCIVGRMERYPEFFDRENI